MATCPFLSYTPISQTNSGATTTEGSGGMFEVTQWDYTYGSLVQVSCIGSSCQIWDSTNNRCGMLVSNTIMDSPTNETDTLITLLESVIGKASERDTSNSFTQWSQSVFGQISEKDNNNSFLIWLRDVIGEIADVDNIPSHTSGTCTHCNQPSKLIEMIQHVNADHWDVGEGAAMPYAAILMSEYQANEDMDNNSKVYGFDFKINIDDPEKPPMLKGMEDHPDFVEPEFIVDWTPLLDWYNGGSAPTFVTNPDYTP